MGNTNAVSESLIFRVDEHCRGRFTGAQHLLTGVTTKILKLWSP